MSKCPDCYGTLGGTGSLSGDQGPNYCHDCEFDYYACGICGKVFNDESEAGDCEYDHRTVLDDLADVVD